MFRLISFTDTHGIELHIHFSCVVLLRAFRLQACELSPNEVPLIEFELNEVLKNKPGKVRQQEGFLNNASCPSDESLTCESVFVRRCM